MTMPYRQLRSASVFLIASVLISASLAAAQQPTPPPQKPAVDPSTMDLEQLMKIEVVVAGSKRAQQTRDVASFVSVVTAADIKQHGYRTLSAVLNTLPSFYLSNDRHFTFLGVRGFGRAGDNNTRVLVLINGLRSNENVYGAAQLGQEFSVDVDMIDRIEVIRGPSAALYGNSAFFAVINVVTKTGESMNGGEVLASAASYGTHAGRVSYGKGFSNGADVLVSATVSESKGQQLYFPEYDAPATNNGLANNADYENFHKLLATVSKGNFSFQASSSNREKGIPTGAYGTLFNDNRSLTWNGLDLASASYSRSLDRGSLSARVFGGHSTVRAAFASDASLPPNQTTGLGDWWGADIDATHRFSRHLLTVGGEFQDDYRQNQKNFNTNPYMVFVDVRNQSVHGGIFAQDEISLFNSFVLYAGIRMDKYETSGSAISPRLGLVYTPDAATTVKLLSGRAFRAPNEFEQHFGSFQLNPNPNLKPERIETLELVAERLIGGGVQLSASTFRNRLSALISQSVDPSDNTQLIFQNADAIESKGVELGLKVNRGHGPTGQLTYALQKTEDRRTGIELTNSPRHMAKLELLAPLYVRNITAGVDAQYVSDRHTISGGVAPGQVVTNLSLLAPLAFGRFDISATVYNLFAIKYGDPGANYQRQNTIPQDGRSLRAQTTLHY
jgi:outer membrane receptor for ferrienterochelin and colicin